MTPAEVLSSDFAEAAAELRAKDQPFAFATIVRTAGASAAKPGAKALLNADGAILQGWLGGGCTRAAVGQATRDALLTGAPQLVSVAPEDQLAERGVDAGSEVDGRRFARNGCPSRGTIDIFIEPCLPMPALAIFGRSPVAKALTTLAPQFHWAVMDEPLVEDPPSARRLVAVVATQGEGDLAALKRALSLGAVHVAFVGSGRKFAALAGDLKAEGASAEDVGAIKAPAGLDIGAVTSEEIALSILAELVQIRRAAARGTGEA